MDSGRSLVTRGDACTDGAGIDAQKKEKFFAKIALVTAATKRAASGRSRGMNSNSGLKPLSVVGCQKGKSPKGSSGERGPSTGSASVDSG